MTIVLYSIETIRVLPVIYNQKCNFAWALCSNRVESLLSSDVEPHWPIDLRDPTRQPVLNFALVRECHESTNFQWLHSIQSVAIRQAIALAWQTQLHP
jgi:hypothetical protein